MLLVLLIVGVVVVLLMGKGGIAWPFSKTSTTANPSSGGLVLGGSDLPVYSDLGVKVLSDPRLENLELHGVFPLTPGVPGRSNPFVQAAPQP